MNASHQANNARNEETQKHQESVSAVGKGSADVVKAINSNGAKTRANTQNVNVENKDLAKSQDIDSVISQLKEVQLAALLGGQKPSVILADSTDLGDQVSALGDKIISVLETLKNDKSNTEAFSKVADQYKTLVTSFQSAAKEQSSAIAKSLGELKTSLDNKDFNPNINVQSPEIDIPPVDIKPLQEAISGLGKIIIDNKVVIPETNFDTLSSKVQAVTSAINSLQFPVPNYVLPFRDYNGQAVQRTIPLPTEKTFERVSNTDGASTAFSNFTAVTDKKNYIRGYSITNTSSSNGYVDFRNGTAGAVLWTVPLPANGGANVMLDDPIFWTSSNTALAFDVSQALTTVYISVTGYQS